MGIAHSKYTGRISRHETRVEVRLQEARANFVYSSYTGYIGDGGLVRRDAYNAAIAPVKPVNVEDPFA
jgi:hypothetical protein